MTDRNRLAGLAVALGAGLAAHAAAIPLAAHPIAVAVRHGDCAAAVSLVNRGAADDDGQAAYLAGRMLDEGICVNQDFEAAARFFARGSNLGDRASSLEYGAKVGLGQGADQSYERAGEICRSAGLDPQAQMSAYALGYACTLRGVAGRLLRETLPPDAFRPNSGTLRVEFDPASARMSIRSMPEVEREREAATGTMLRAKRVDAPRAVEEAWRKALSIVPKPEPGRLASQPIELSLDVDMTLEIRRQASGARTSHPELHTLQPGDLMLPNVR